MKEELDHLISSLEAEGAAEGTGSFGLDPRRALEILREQGSLGHNAPLFLLWAIHKHTQGASITWKRSVFTHHLRWPEQFGELPNETYRILATKAFEAFSIKLTFHPGSVAFQARFMGDPFTVNFERTFGVAEPRLQHYPVEGLFEKQELPHPSLVKEYPEGRLEFRLTKSHTPRLRWIVRGIEFEEPSPLPLDFTIFDNNLKPDLSLSTIPDAEGKEFWLERAQALFLERLHKGLLEVEPLLLDHPDCPQELPLAIDFLPYIVALGEDSSLRVLTLDLVRLRDVFEEHWSLGELLQRHQSDGGILVVPSVPTDCPAKSLGKRPVLLWTGESKRLGQGLFSKISSGAGYLYSLRRGEAVMSRRRGEQDTELAAVDLEQGRLRLKKSGDRHSRCEVELVGERRASEKVHLDEPAPLGLRLVWASREEVPSWDFDADFRKSFQNGVVELVDQAFGHMETTPQWRRNLLMWAVEVRGLAEYPNLYGAPTLEGVRGDWYSLKLLRESFDSESPIPILQDRSSSLPELMPLPIVLWEHPLLNRFELPTAEVGALVRQAYWQEDGRKKWLNRFEPASALSLDELQGERRLVLEEGHILATRSGATDSVLLFWREGRPLGRVRLPSRVWPPGCTVVYLDDDFPVDPYWSGPDLEAVENIFSWLTEVREREPVRSLLDAGSGGQSV